MTIRLSPAYAPEIDPIRNKIIAMKEVECIFELDSKNQVLKQYSQCVRAKRKTNVSHTCMHNIHLFIRKNIASLQLIIS
jgi:hypothetical protein